MQPAGGLPYYYPMAIVLALLFILLFFCYSTMKPTPRNWPAVGMLPGLLRNAHRIHEFATDLVKASGGTFVLKGPVFSDMDMLVTADPANIHHILSRNFSNYPKGPQFRKMFDILGDGIFNVDSHLWELHRKITLSIFNHPRFFSMLEKNMWQKVENGLLPVLDVFVEKKTHFDLQEIFQRLTFDTISAMVLQEDPASLSVGLPYIPAEKAFNLTVEALFYRHVLPESFWRLQNWLGVGIEKKLNQARRDLDDFIYSSIRRLREDRGQGVNHELSDDRTLFAAFGKAYEEQKWMMTTGSTEFLRDTFLSLIFAGRDTTSTALTWLFWLLARNPQVLAKVRQEIEETLNSNKQDKLRFFKAEETKKLVYLHGALCESLRLFPPVALEHKVAAGKDVLPSGHRVEPNTRVILSFYSTGRMAEAWGEDCGEFKPERWVCRGGRTKHQPSYKFPAFNAGPRTCLGKEMSFVQMKMVAAKMLHDYEFRVVDPSSVSTSDLIILQAKHGLIVQFTHRIN
ncbi:unnamed protein product [Cuscuta campestris]|uniref:Cytochrome P450 n=1 Tax=Cuscuta campestris TaxID=132261 RepID=A0A484JZ91_9ASTE|nr:unnamed protein product [Cuscuta campestris]